MQHITKLAIALFLGIGLCSQAQAGFLIEPYFGFAVTGESDFGGSTSDLSGTALGARIGMTTLGFMYGLEYDMASLTMENDDGDEADVDATNIGAFVGFEFPILLRVWLSYYLSSEGELENDGGTLKGSGYKLGVGYTGLPFVSINLEMVQTTFDEAEAGGVSGDLTEDVKNSVTMISVSLPLP